MIRHLTNDNLIDMKKNAEDSRIFFRGFVIGVKFVHVYDIFCLGELRINISTLDGYYLGEGCFTADHSHNLSRNSQGVRR